MRLLSRCQACYTDIRSVVAPRGGASEASCSRPLDPLPPPLTRSRPSNCSGVYLVAHLCLARQRRHRGRRGGGPPETSRCHALAAPVTLARLQGCITPPPPHKVASWAVGGWVGSGESAVDALVTRLVGAWRRQFALAVKRKASRARGPPQAPRTPPPLPATLAPRARRSATSSSASRSGSQRARSPPACPCERASVCTRHHTSRDLASRHLLRSLHTMCDEPTSTSSLDVASARAALLEHKAGLETEHARATQLLDRFYSLRGQLEEGSRADRPAEALAAGRG